MMHTVYRLTPSRTLTLNNRWFNYVYPKNSLFFQPYDKDEMWKWVRFLCDAQDRTYLWCHTVIINTPKLVEREYGYKRSFFHEYVVSAEKTNIVKQVKLQKVGQREAQVYVGNLLRTEQLLQAKLSVKGKRRL